VQKFAHRHAYIDWARGIAVLLMIEAHTSDAWTRPTDRITSAFRDATILGGFAAPLFLWLAGLSVVLAAARTAERSGSRAAALDAACRRGLEVFILAFLFRLQGFFVTPGGAPLMILRVDILNIMGPSMIAAALLWAAARTTAATAAVLASTAAAVAMTTPIVRSSGAIDLLPTWMQWYLRPAGDLTTFTLLPWSAFVLAGAATGSLIAAAGDRRSERVLHVALACAGTALIAVGFYAAARPSIYPSADFWTTSPTWFAIRLGVLMVALVALFAFDRGRPVGRLGRAASFAPRVLERFGRASLFIYWIHVELVYGYASWLWRHRLPLWGAVLAYAAFCALMYGAVVLRDRLVKGWRARRLEPSTEPATA